MVSRTSAAATSLCEPHGAPQRPGGNGLRKCDLAVDDDDGEVDAVASLELVVAVDRDAPELESEARRLALEQLERAGAETATCAFVEHDLDCCHAGAAQPATVKPSWRSLVTSSLETALITRR